MSLTFTARKLQKGTLQTNVTLLLPTLEETAIVSMLSEFDKVTDSD